MTEAVLIAGVLYLIGMTQGDIAFVAFAAAFIVAVMIDAVNE